MPDWENYIEDYWYGARAVFTWEKTNVIISDDLKDLNDLPNSNYYHWSIKISYNIDEEKLKEWKKYALPVITPPDGEYEGQKIEKIAWVWLP